MLFCNGAQFAITAQENTVFQVFSEGESEAVMN